MLFNSYCCFAAVMHAIDVLQIQEDEEGLSLTGNGRSSGDESGWKQVYI
jgi:hypothetical protein